MLASALNEILKKHKMWIRGEERGERANLYEANLRGANLRGADLSCADLSGANLRGANLRGANLRGANLSCADLSCADFSCADLSGANLRGANLCGAKIDEKIKNMLFPLACPESGSFIGWKKVRCGLIVKLEIPDDAKRSSAYGRKCRADKALVLRIENEDGSISYDDTAYSWRDISFEYKVGKIVTVSNFDEDRWNECSTGIHFFITRQEAVDYDI